MLLSLRRFHLAALALASLAAAVALLGMHGHLQTLTSRYIHLVAPRGDLLLTRSPALQAAALAQPDLLPMYGSSEMNLPVTDRAPLFFRNYPTGFEIYPVGQAGTYPLVMLQKLAAMGTQLRGRKIVLSLSSGWFRREEMSLEAFAGNFSPLDRSELVFSSELNPGLKQEIARRLITAAPADPRPPLAAFALRQLAAGSFLGTAGYALAWPLGKLQTVILRLQDQYETWGFLLHQRGRPDLVRHEAAVLDWPRLIAEANREVEDSPAQGLVPATAPAPPLHLDQTVAQRIADSHLWGDLDLLLRTLRELGAQPLLLSTPFTGPRLGGQQLSAGTRQLYHERFAQAVGRYGFAYRDFAEHDTDRHFGLDLHDHLSVLGWMTYNQTIDEFFHSPPRVLATPGQITGR
jgi:D-alanine transfer protein